MIRRYLAGLALAAVAAAAHGGSCPAHYMEGRLPEIRNDRLASATRELCYGEFGVMHSGVTRTPLWSAEYVHPDKLRLARTLSRDNAFHAEPRLHRRERAELRDYARSGYDRGHMAPNANMPDRDSQYESFTLANMVPQDPDNNRHTWSSIEKAVRKMARQDGGLYVVTGPAFIGERLQKVGKVFVPTHLYKAVYSPRKGAGGAWFVENRAQARPRVLTLAELEREIGIDVMPALSERQKRTLLKLPAIRASDRTSRRP